MSQSGDRPDMALIARFLAERAPRSGDPADTEQGRESVHRGHIHQWGPWQDDVAGVVRECACGEIECRPEG